MVEIANPYLTQIYRRDVASQDPALVGMSGC